VVASRARKLSANDLRARHLSQKKLNGDERYTRKGGELFYFSFFFSLDLIFQMEAFVASTTEQI
jgi:hypothetical protein